MEARGFGTTWMRTFALLSGTILVPLSVWIGLDFGSWLAAYVALCSGGLMTAALALWAAFMIRVDTISVDFPDREPFLRAVNDALPSVGYRQLSGEPLAAKPAGIGFLAPQISIAIHGASATFTGPRERVRRLVRYLTEIDPPVAERIERLTGSMSSRIGLRKTDSGEPMGSEADVWALVQALVQAIPFRKEGIEALLGSKLLLASHNDYFKFYEPKRIGTNPFGVEIGDIDLRVKKDEPRHPGFLAISLLRAPVTRQAVMTRYPAGRPVPPRPGPPPQGISPDASSVYWVQEAWGQLGFGFLVKAPDRLESIAFDVNKRD